MSGPERKDLSESCSPPATVTVATPTVEELGEQQGEKQRQQERQPPSVLSRIPGIDEDEDVEEAARKRLQRGNTEIDELIEDLCEYYEVGGDAIPGIATAVESALQKLLTEQETWPDDEQADMKNLIKAFRVLESKNVISRADFSCCSRCGNGEIRAEAETEHIGYCYFHEQDLTACIEGSGLCLRHGVVGPDWADVKKRENLAKLLVNTMEEACLKVEWNGNINKVIDLPGFKWRVRLHGSSEDGGKVGEGNEDRVDEDEQEGVNGDSRAIEEDNEAEVDEDIEGDEFGMPTLSFSVR